MADTAVIETPVTAAAPEAPPEETLPEIAELESSPETEGDTETPDQEAEADPFEGLTPKEIAAKLRADIRKDEKAKADESVRRQLQAKADEETAKAQTAVYQANTQRAANARGGYAYQALYQIAGQAATRAAQEAYSQGKDSPVPVIDPRQIAAVSQEVTIAATHDAHESVLADLWNGILAINPNYAPPLELSRKAEAAAKAYDLRAVAATQIEMMTEAIDQVRGRQAEARAEAETAAKTAATAKAPTKPRPGGPTAIAGGSGRGGTPTTQREADALVMAAGSAEERRAALAVARALRQRGAPW